MYKYAEPGRIILTSAFYLLCEVRYYLNCLLTTKSYFITKRSEKLLTSVLNLGHWVRIIDVLFTILKEKKYHICEYMNTISNDNFRETELERLCG